MSDSLIDADTKITELHSPEEIKAEMERLRVSPEMRWWLGLVNGEWRMQGAMLESILRCEAYNRLTVRMFR